jgi:hypothetical protein
VVRGPAAVLVAVLALAAAQIYFLVPQALPVITPVDTSVFVACSCAIIAIYLCIAVTMPLSDVPPLLWLLAIGAFLLVAGLNVADVGAASTPIEAVAYAAAGALFAIGLLTPALALALPVFVAGIDVLSTFAGGPSELLANAGQTQPGDPLSLELPDWGNGLPAGRIGISDAVFAGVFLLFARRFGLRPRATAAGLAAASIIATALRVWLDRAIPVLPLMAAAYFLVNADRLPALVRAASDG